MSTRTKSDKALVEYIPVYDLIQRELFLVCIVDLFRDLLERDAGRLDVQALVLALAEDLRKVIRHEPAQHQVRVRHSERAAFPVWERQPPLPCWEGEEGQTDSMRGQAPRQRCLDRRGRGRCGR